jgi:uncharacterized protein YqgV (UPF0045/DUF77 family)
VDLTLKENNENMFNTHFETLATKEGFANLQNEFTRFRGDVKEEFANVRGEMNKEFANVRGEMNKEFANVRGEMKAEFASVRGEMNEGFTVIRGEMNEGFAAIRGEMKEVGFEAQTGISRLELYIAKIKGELEVKISESKSDIFRWMFAFFVTMLLAVLGLYFKK